MVLGHLAPCGPIAAAVERSWRPEWPRWTHVLPWAAALAGCVFPDLDIIANILINGVSTHPCRWPHSAFPYLPVLIVGWLLVRRERTRLAGLTVLTFEAAILSHLLLDTISHGAVLFYPLWNGAVGWTCPPRAGESVMMAYFHSPNVWLEVGVIAVAGVWWLRRYVGVWGRRRAGRAKRVALGYLSALPRHEGSRLLRSEGPR